MTLSNADYFDYISAHLNLLYFVGQQSTLVPKNMDFEAFVDAELALKASCRDHFLNHIGFLDDYFSAKAGQLSDEEISTLSGFRKAVTGDFFIYKCMANFALFLETKTNKFYAVKALRDPFDRFFGLFPVIVSTTILPYRGMIIYDGFLNSKNISFGSGIKSSLKEAYDEAKRKGHIIKTL